MFWVAYFALILNVKSCIPKKYNVNQTDQFKTYGGSNGYVKKHNRIIRVTELLLQLIPSSHVKLV